MRNPDAYERLLLDVIRGNPTLFMRGDEVEAAWRWIDPIRRAWERDGRSGSRAAGREAIVMRAGPAGRLARAVGKGERAPERRQNAARAPPERSQHATRRPPDGRQNASDASKRWKTIDFRALRLRR